MLTSNCTLHELSHTFHLGIFTNDGHISHFPELRSGCLQSDQRLNNNALNIRNSFEKYEPENNYATSHVLYLAHKIVIVTMFRHVDMETENSNEVKGWNSTRTRCTELHYDEEGIQQLAAVFHLSSNQEYALKSALQNLPTTPLLTNKLLSMLNIHLTDGLVGALLFNLAAEQHNVDMDELLVDAVAMERYLMYNNCRENSDKGSVQRSSKENTSKTLKHVMNHSKTLNSTADVQRRYMATLLKIPSILNQYITAVKTNKPLLNKNNAAVPSDAKPVSPFLQAPIYPGDYPTVGERNQDAFELQEKRRKKLRLRWSQIASPCLMKDRHLNTIAHSNNLHVWSLNERRKDLVRLPRLTLSELSKHPDNLTIEDVTELREKVNFLKSNYYKSYLNATEMGTEEHWTELLGHEITSPVLQQVTKASFMTYSNPRYKLTFSPWEPKPFWMLRRNPTQCNNPTNGLSSQGCGQWRAWCWKLCGIRIYLRSYMVFNKVMFH